MNKIIREHYPVANLPKDLKEGLEEGATVRVIVEVEAIAAAVGTGSDKSMKAEELLARRQQLQSENRPSVSTEEAVARIRALRDEWDH